MAKGFCVFYFFLNNRRFFFWGTTDTPKLKGFTCFITHKESVKGGILESIWGVFCLTLYYGIHRHQKESLSPTRKSIKSLGIHFSQYVTSKGYGPVIKDRERERREEGKRDLFFLLAPSVSLFRIQHSDESRYGYRYV